MPSSTDKDGRIAILGLYLLVGLIIGYIVASNLPSQNVRHRSDWLNNPYSYVRQQDKEYSFISPLLDSELPSQQLSQQLYPYEKKIVSSVRKIISAHPDDRVSFYYKDLTNASWVGIGENEEYIPASLLKIPIAIAFYKLSESDPALLTQKITPTGTDQNDQRNIPASNTIEIGKSYTIEEMISTMLIDSDNNALEALYTYKSDALKKIFQDLQQHFPSSVVDIANNEYVSPRSYSRFLMILYNGSYLYREHSEKLLKLLSQTTFRDGLVAGVPKSIVVAHKFGERQIEENGQTKVRQFHDCGIVYFPNRPYKLCIMTQGSDLNVLQAITKDISTAVYQQVEQATS